MPMDDVVKERNKIQGRVYNLATILNTVVIVSVCLVFKMLHRDEKQRLVVQVTDYEPPQCLVLECSPESCSKLIRTWAQGHDDSLGPPTRTKK